MIDAHQRPLVGAPARALHAHQPVVGALGGAHDPPRDAERAQQRRGARHRPVREVPDGRVVRRGRVELAPHVRRRELRKGARLEARALEHPVHAREVQGPGLGAQHVVGKRRAAVRAGHRGQRGDPHGEPALPEGVRNHPARVEAAHAVGDDVDARRGVDARPGNLIREPGGPVGDGARRRDGGGDDGCALRRERLADAVPVVDAWEGRHVQL